MLVLIAALLIIGFFFPPAWLALLGLGIYLVASRKSRRSDAVESRVKKVISAGKDSATFSDLYFEAARSYAIEKGAKATEQNAASTQIIVDGRNYFVVFSRSATGGTMISVEDADAVRRRVFDDVVKKGRKTAWKTTSTTENRNSKSRYFGSDGPPSNILTDLDFAAEIILITQSGKTLMTSESLEHENPEHLDGAVFEVMVKMRDGDPFFIYYKCEEYYFLSLQQGSIRDLQKGSQWRAEVSQRALIFLKEYIRYTTQKDIGPKMVSYHHNAKHTNVIAYVETLDGWYPIQQNDSDHEDTTESKVSAINSGKAKVSQFIAISELSPNA